MNKKGQSTVEFALAALVLIPVFLVILDLSVMFYVNLTMLHAVREGARSAVVGQPSTDPGQGAARRSALTQKIIDSSNGLYIPANIVAGPVVSVLSPPAPGFTNYTGNPVADTGQPNDIIIVSLTYAWPLLTPVLRVAFPDNKYTFTVRATMKNEPWGP
jgi:Flp pilus assembly protein TadG